MITISPITKALVPADSKAADRLSSPNYDEFQNDREVWEIIRGKPDSILRIKMPHCDVSDPNCMLDEGSAEALAHAGEKMDELKNSPQMQVLENLLYVYEIDSPIRPGKPQIGLGCFAKTSEILTDKTPSGVIIRNEGIREKKMKGRADLIQATKSFIGVVNNAVEDKSTKILESLRLHARSFEPSFQLTDERRNLHRVWLITNQEQQKVFIELFASEPYAYVADGNHRSAAAAMLGHENYLTVFFVADTMGICPYNRLVNVPPLPLEKLLSSLGDFFSVSNRTSREPYQPQKTHDIGLYTSSCWYELHPQKGSFDAANAVASLDSSLVQDNIFSRIFDISDARDERLTFVGSNKDAAYLMAQVDCGAAQYAFTLPPVTMEQFIEVCRQRRMMPPKSTWFEPKIRSGLVIALL